MADGITQNYTKKERAAVLVAEDDLTDEQIAAAVGVTRKTLHNWKQTDEFVTAVNEQVSQIQAGMRRLAIAKKHKRVAVLDDLHAKALKVIEERTVVENGEPGESTGLVVRQYKQVGSGKDAQIIEEFAVDTALMREIRAIEEQAAKELGQWADKSEVNLGGSLRREYVIVSGDAV